MAAEHGFRDYYIRSIVKLFRWGPPRAGCIKIAGTFDVPSGHGDGGLLKALETIDKKLELKKDGELKAGVPMAVDKASDGGPVGKKLHEQWAADLGKNIFTPVVLQSIRTSKRGEVPAEMWDEKNRDPTDTITALTFGIPLLMILLTRFARCVAIAGRAAARRIMDCWPLLDIVPSSTLLRGRLGGLPL